MMIKKNQSVSALPPIEAKSPEPKSKINLLKLLGEFNETS